MKKDTRFKHVKVAILNHEYSVFVYIGDKEKSVRQISKYLEDPDVFIQDVRGKTFWRFGYHPCIWIGDTKDTVLFSATLAHESIHAVTHIMSYIGMNAMDDTGGELLAHSVAAVMRKCL